jgi:hypothetical protein
MGAPTNLWLVRNFTIFDLCACGLKNIISKSLSLVLNTGNPAADKLHRRHVITTLMHLLKERPVP